MFTENPLSTGVQEWLTESKRRHMVRPDEEGLRITYYEGCNFETLLMVLAGGVSLSYIQTSELVDTIPFICLTEKNKLVVALASGKTERAPYCPANYVAITYRGDGGINKLSVESRKVIVLPPQNT